MNDKGLSGKARVGLLAIGILVAWGLAYTFAKENSRTGDSAPPVSIPDHYYEMQDGMKYGYKSALSDNDRKAGQVAEKLVMALYAGQRNGKHQAHIRDGLTVTAIECAAPCEYLKVMTYVDNPYLDDQVKVETIVANPQTLGYLIMQDAIRGKLKPYGMQIDGKAYTMWVDEQKGMRRFPMTKG